MQDDPDLESRGLITLVEGSEGKIEELVCSKLGEGQEGEVEREKEFRGR